MCDPTDIANVAFQGATLGLVGVDEGGFKAGLTGQAIKEVTIDPLKDISGATAAEDANALAREQMEEEKASRLQAREDAKSQSAAEQVRASRSAGGVRTSTSGRTSGLTSAIVGEDERDFLGL